MSQVARDVVQAEESARVMALLGRALVVPAAAESWESVADAAAERAAIVSEGAGGSGVGGLVSLPTSDTERCSASMTERAVALRRHLRAFAPDARRARLGRMRRAVGFAARAHEVSVRPGFRADYCAMLTLTYRGGVDAWQPLHIAGCLKAMREWCRRRSLPMRYVWVAELQRRGSVHYHVALWLPAGVVIPKADRRGWWPHGASRIEAARAAVPYLLKYLSKGDTAEWPKGLRVHGAGGLEHAMRRARRWLGLPSFVKARSDIFDDWGRVVGGGWADPDGVCIPSEFQRAWVGDRWSCLRVADYGRPFEADGAFTWLSRRPVQ